ncbi:uncharacterized protein [Nicotiana sylvestris]|uniref:uncharacterized protein n=1 Tax=Nicotiana sylvestris TaxID=4096 RepID=UPI00388CD507
MLRKDDAMSWTEESKKAFNKIKEYLSKLPVLVLPEPRRPLVLYMSMLDGAFGCVLGQHDEMGGKNCTQGQALADHLAENPIDGEYKPLKIYFPNEKVSFVGEDISETYDGWRMFFDGAANFKGVGIRATFVLVHKQYGRIRIQNELADGLVTLSSMIQHQDKNFIDFIPIEIRKQPAYCTHVEEEFDGNPWYHNIKEYLKKGEYSENATNTQKRTF